VIPSATCGARSAKGDCIALSWGGILDVKQLALLLAIVGAALVAFGYWGVETRAGRRMFDEMAGIIPWALGLLGWLLLAVGAGLFVWRRVRS
jgi:hypothetical protein